jgi:4-amino-4-deoxychorismate lyase
MTRLGQSKLSRSAVFNGELRPAGSVKVSPFSDGFMFGQGVFETLRVSDGQPEFWAGHWERLEAGARALGLGYEQTSAGLLHRCQTLIEADGATDSVLKIAVFRDGEITSELISLREIPYTALDFERGFALKVVHGCGASPLLSGLKTQNYLANLLTLRAARSEGFDEVVFVNDRGELLEGATTNVWAVKDGVAWTPRTDVGVLPGIIRARLLADAPACAREKRLGLGDLLHADEVFVTNSILRVMPVREIDGRTFSSRAIADRLRARL